MKTKRVFGIINIVALVLTIVLVSVNFHKGLMTGNEIYSQIYAFSNSANASNLSDGLYNSAVQTEKVKKDTSLTDTQIKYLYKLKTTLDSMTASEQYLILYLLGDKSKSTNTAKLSNQYNTLSDMRTELSHDYTIYQTKMSGNIYGDPEGTFKLILQATLKYLKTYAETIQNLNNYVHNDLNLSNETMYHLIDIQNRLVINACENLANLTFEFYTLDSLTKFNSMFKFDSSKNIQTNSTSAIGGIYSIEAYQFNVNFNRCNPYKFCINFYSYKTSLDVTTETDNAKLAYYYLCCFLGGI